MTTASGDKATAARGAGSPPAAARRTHRRTPRRGVHGLLGAVVCPAPAVDDALLRQRRRPAGRVRVEPARDSRTRQRHVIHGKGAVMNLVSSTSTPRGARVRFGGHVGRVRGCAVGHGAALQRAVSAAAASLPAKVERAHPGRHFKVALHYCPMVHCSDE